MSIFFKVLINFFLFVISQASLLHPGTAAALFLVNRRDTALCDEHRPLAWIRQFGEYLDDDMRPSPSDVFVY